MSSELWDTRCRESSWGKGVGELYSIFGTYLEGDGSINGNDRIWVFNDVVMWKKLFGMAR